MQSNPIDKAAMIYLWNDSGIDEEYGEIKHVNKNISHKTEKNNNTIRAPYMVETEEYQILVYVTLENNNGNWVAVSFEAEEVEKIES